MGNEGFARVFAPSVKEVQRLYNKHQKAAWTWFLLTVALAAGVTIGVYLLLGKYGEAISHPLVAKITLAMIGGELIAVIAAIIATRYHNTKVEQFKWQLEHEYIVFSPRERTRFYNL